MSIRVTPQAPKELGYAEITADVTQTGSGNQDVTGLSVTVEVGTRPIIVSVGAKLLSNSTSSGVATLSIKESTTTLATASVVLSTFSLPVFRSVRLAPSAGSHTYKINLAQLVSGNAVIGAGSTDPAFIQVVEV